MVKSFNRSIDAALGEFVVMVTDDDPVFANMLDYFFSLHEKYPEYALYCGIKRRKKKAGEIEVIDKDRFIAEFLNPKLTVALHWSSCLIQRTALLEIGKLPDFGSGHLVDHIMLTMLGSINGAVIVNQEFSSIQLHQSNYSKANFNNYYVSCTAFYNAMTKYIDGKPNFDRNYTIIIKHLHAWFISCFFGLRKFYTIQKIDNEDVIKELDLFANKILDLKYMRIMKYKYEAKKVIFSIKKMLGTF